jgi:Kef-type K+ transport system membrane component KefB
MGEQARDLVLVAAAIAAAPLLADYISRWVRVPLVAFEIGLGILLGPDVTGWVKADPDLQFLGTLGLAMLFLLAGYELDFERIRGRSLRLAAIGWLCSLAVATVCGISLTPTVTAGILVGICLTSTAMGTIMPVLRDAGELSTRFGNAVLAIGAVGEFGPLIAVALFLSDRRPGRSAVILIIFTAIIGAALYVALRYEHAHVHRLIEATLHTSGQFAVRLVILVLACLAGLATAFGLDMLLGAFAAGLVISLLMRRADSEATRTVEAKLDAVGFGFLIPVFFVNTGITFDLNALLDHPETLALVPAFLILFILIRGIPATVAAPPGSGTAERLAIAAFAATGLPIIVAVTTIGVNAHEIKQSTAAALVGAGMLSVLTLPLLGLMIRRRQLAAAQTA